jgi:hypothetical protein
MRQCLLTFEVLFDFDAKAFFFKVPFPLRIVGICFADFGVLASIGSSRFISLNLTSSFLTSNEKYW